MQPHAAPGASARPGYRRAVLSDTQLDRYARHLILKEIGGAGQAKLLAARVAVVGAGGIGSPALQYLAAAGIGHLSVIDDDRVELSNLQRQTLFVTSQIGARKAEAAATALAAINPDARVTPHAVRITPANVDAMIAGHDVVLDGTDNFATRLLVAEAARRHRIPLVSAAVAQFEGQLGVFRGWEAGKPCYQCLVGSDPARAGESCAEDGVLGALTGVLGSLAALEVCRAIVPFGSDSAGRLLIVDGLDFRFRTIDLPKDPGCPACG